MDRNLLIGGVLVLFLFIGTTIWRHGMESKPAVKQPTTRALQKTSASVKAKPAQQPKKKAAVKPLKKSSADVKK